MGGGSGGNRHEQDSAAAGDGRIPWRSNRGATAPVCCGSGRSRRGGGEERVIPPRMCMSCGSGNVLFCFCSRGAARRGGVGVCLSETGGGRVGVFGPGVDGSYSQQRGLRRLAVATRSRGGAQPQR